MTYLFLLLLLTITSALQISPAISGNIVAGNRPQETTRSLWKLAVYWPNSWCRTALIHCIQTTPQNQFLIRTLYKVDERDWPVICSSRPPINQTQMDQVKDLLSIYWPDLNGDNFKNWELAWQKHASCFGVDPFTYFLQAIYIKLQTNRRITPNLGIGFDGEPFYGALSANNIYPGNNYPPASISTAFSGKYGLPVDVRCNNDDVGVNQLMEIHICAEAFADGIFRVRPCRTPPIIEDCNEYTRYT